MVTDHKPLTSILGPKKGVPAIAAAQLQRWAILLGAYNYAIEFRSMGEYGNADALSWLPLPEEGPRCLSETSLYNIRQIEALPPTSQEIQKATQQDPILNQVLSYCLKGWPETVPIALRPYQVKMAELSVQDGCLLWGGWVVIPPCLKNTILTELHKDHMGVLVQSCVVEANG